MPVHCLCSTPLKWATDKHWSFAKISLHASMIRNTDRTVQRLCPLGLLKRGYKAIRRNASQRKFYALIVLAVWDCKTSIATCVVCSHSSLLVWKETYSLLAWHNSEGMGIKECLSFWHYPSGIQQGSRSGRTGPGSDPKAYWKAACQHSNRWWQMVAFQCPTGKRGEQSVYYWDFPLPNMYWRWCNVVPCCVHLEL